MKKVKNADEFFEEGDFIVAKDKIGEDEVYKFLHDDFDLMKEQIDEENRKNDKEIYGYTLIDGEGGSLFIVEGVRWVNRLGYYLSLEKIKFEYDELEL